jgi:hypothetical protein
MKLPIAMEAGMPLAATSAGTTRNSRSPPASGASYLRHGLKTMRPTPSRAVAVSLSYSSKGLNQTFLPPGMGSSGCPPNDFVV